jgi:hypothetical protein
MNEKTLKSIIQKEVDIYNLFNEKEKSKFFNIKFLKTMIYSLVFIFSLYFIQPILIPVIGYSAYQLWKSYAFFTNIFS